MNKKKFLIMLLIAGSLLWAAGRIFAQEATQPSHDSTSVIERAERRITPEQRKDAARRAADARAQKSLETTSSDSTSSDTTTGCDMGGGTTNE
ncbi:MAG: hypothetical protein PHX78_04325 [bacterium]|nr:hypothetical protein [bacterium]